MIVKRDCIYTPKGKNRPLHIYLPDDYAYSQERYPVMYMFDGQNAFDEDTILHKAQEQFATAEPTDEQIAEAKKALTAQRELFKMIQQTKANGGKPVVVSTQEDELLSHTRGYGKSEQRPEDYLDAFSAYVKNNINQIVALQIDCTRPRELTRETLKQLRLALDLEGFTTQQLNTAISQLTNEEMAADIIDSGITLVGGGSLLPGWEELLSKETGVACMHSASPLESVVTGVGNAFRYKDQIKHGIQNENILA